jgi:hypothetical protein
MLCVPLQSFPSQQLDSELTCDGKVKSPGIEHQCEQTETGLNLTEKRTVSNSYTGVIYSQKLKPNLESDQFITDNQ